MLNDSTPLTLDLSKNTSTLLIPPITLILQVQTQPFSPNMPPDMKDSDSHIPSPSKPKIGYVDPDLSVDGSSGSVGMLGIGTTEGLSPSRYRCYR